MSFGKNLLSLRKANGLSQDELGSQLNVSRQTISKWELDETTPEMDKLALMSEYFNISLDELVMDKKPSNQVEVNIPPSADISLTKSVKDIVFLALKIIGAIVGGLILVDVIVMIIYFTINGFPS